MSKKYSPKHLDILAELDKSSSETWQTSYSDMMTIILVFFALLISATNISAIKFERIKQAFQGKTEDESIASVLVDLEEHMKDSNLENQVKIKVDDKSIQISFLGGLLFDSGKARVKPEAEKLLQEFSKKLGKLPSYAHLAVEGHTDDNPIESKEFRSNWHLSTLRSLAVLEILEAMDICQENCEARGFGEHRPELPNRDQDGNPIAKNQTENRRVVLRIF